MNRKTNIIKPLIFLIILFSLIMLGYTIFSAYMKSKTQMYVDTSSIELVQLDPPKDGDPIAVVETSLGEVRFVLYPQYSPNAVKNFTELAQSGYYDNTYVFHSESGAYSALGSTNRDGTLADGYDKERELIGRELHQNLWPLRGAVCCLTSTVDKTFFESMFGGGKYYCGSRFALINSIEMTDEIKEELLSSSGSEELAKAFAENGGVPNFSQRMTIIGQTYKGLDVVEKLANLEVYDSDDGIYKIPKEEVMIISVKIGEYSSQEEASEAQ